MSQASWRDREAQRKRIRGALVAGEAFESIMQREGCSLATIKKQAQRPEVLQGIARTRVGTALKALENAELANLIVREGLIRMQNDFKKDPKVRLEPRELRDIAYVGQYTSETAGELLKQAGITDDQLDADGELTKAIRNEIKKQVKKVKHSQEIIINVPGKPVVDDANFEEEAETEESEAFATPDFPEAASGT